MAEAAVTTRLKKLINTPETEVKDAMAGMAAAHADLILRFMTHPRHGIAHAHTRARRCTRLRIGSIESRV